MEFFCLTPLPGSEDHQTLWRKGVAMDSDLNRYDTEHVVTAHPRMGRDELQEIYRNVWKLYYTPAHMERILRRAGATGMSLSSVAGKLLLFSLAMVLEGVHPLQSGIVRLKYRRDRRSGLPIEPAWRFYLSYIGSYLHNLMTAARMARWLRRMTERIKVDPERFAYVDDAIRPASDDDFDSLELFNQTDAARHAVAHARKLRALTSAPNPKFA